MSLLCLPIIYLLTSYLCPTYLLLSTYYLPNLLIYLPIYLLCTYLLHTYLSIYLYTYLVTSLFIYLPIYLSTYVFVYMYLLFTYLSTQLGIYLSSYEKNSSSNVVIHIDKTFHASSRKHVKLIGIKLFYKMVGWFDGQDISVELRGPRFNPVYQHILCKICIFVYITCTCV